MATRERRSLWGSISQSKKVNALSDRAVILYVFTMAQLDDEGFIDADPRTLKSTVVPLRDNIQVKDIPKLTEEISTIHEQVQSSPKPLWVIHETSQGTFIQDPYFNERQIFKGIRKKPSQIKDVVDSETEGQQKGDVEETKGCLSEGEGKGEEKGKVKGRGRDEAAPGCFPSVDHVQEFVDLFNSSVQYIPKVSQITKTRKDKILTRQKEKHDLPWWKTVFEKADLVLIPGKNGKKDWFPNFDWLIENDTNAVKVFEDRYSDAKRPMAPFKPQPGIAAALEKHRMEDQKDGV